MACSTVIFGESANVFPLFDPLYSSEYVFIYDISNHAPVFKQAIPIANAYHGLVWDPIAANQALANLPYSIAIAGLTTLASNEFTNGVGKLLLRNRQSDHGPRGAHAQVRRGTPPHPTRPRKHGQRDGRLFFPELSHLQLSGQFSQFRHLQ
jgi:hypothetical protein